MSDPKIHATKFLFASQKLTFPMYATQKKKIVQLQSASTKRKNPTSSQQPTNHELSQAEQNPTINRLTTSTIRAEKPCKKVPKFHLNSDLGHLVRKSDITKGVGLKQWTGARDRD